MIFSSWPLCFLFEWFVSNLNGLISILEVYDDGNENEKKISNSPPPSVLRGGAACMHRDARGGTYWLWCVRRRVYVCKLNAWVRDGRCSSTLGGVI